MSKRSLGSLWIRVGDGGDYDAFGDDLDAVIEHLNDLGVGAVDHWRQGGVITANYWGNDYISLYYGDKEGNFVADLDAHERKQVEQRLQEAFI